MRCLFTGAAIFMYIAAVCLLSIYFSVLLEKIHFSENSFRFSPKASPASLLTTRGFSYIMDCSCRKETKPPAET